MTSGAAHHESTPPSDWIARVADQIRNGGRVLDLACGRGRHTRLLSERGFHVVAVDRDVSGVADLESDARVTVVEADLESESWPLDGETFDAVVVTNYLYRPHLLALVDLLVDGGLLAYETFARGQEAYGRPRNSDYLLQQNELRDTFAPHLEVLEFKQYVASPPAVRQRILARKRGAESAG
ncbi:MAG: class I SAM-dependent methyltransferase [Myxococcota bacterium]